MKRLCSVLIVMLLLSGCASHTTETTSLPNQLDSDVADVMSDLTHDGNNTEDDAPPRIPILNYSSVETFVSSISSDFNEDVLDEIENCEKKSDRGTFRSFRTKLIDNNTLYVPSYQGKKVTFRNEEELPNISLLASEWYGKPWIWFHARIEEKDVIIKTLYLDDVFEKEANEKGATWYIAKVSPDAPNLDTYASYSFYKDAYEKEIDLCDRTVKALVFEYNEDPRIQFSFIYDGIMACVLGFEESLTDEWFEQFGFQLLPIAKLN